MILTIGHSTHEIDELVRLLSEHATERVVDIRSSPFSARAPQFNRPVLQQRLRRERMAYEFAGDVLGGRPEDPALYVNNQVSYARVRNSEVFRVALSELTQTAAAGRTVLLCSEAEPLECPRFLLIGRELVHRGVEVHHILRDGQAESQRETEARLVELTRQGTPDLFAAPEELLDRAYQIQEARIAFKRQDV